MTQSYNQSRGVLCPRCGSQLLAGAAACRVCGLPTQQLQEPMIFPQEQPTQPQVRIQKQTAPQPPDAQPLRVIAMEKKYTLVACLKDLLLPGHGFLYAEVMSEGALVGLITIPLTVWGVINYMQLWITDLLTNLRSMGSYGYAPSFSASDNFKTWFIILSLIWLFARFIWLKECVARHNEKIMKEADVNQLAMLVKEK